MENRSEKMLRQIPEGYVTLHIAILKKEKQAQGKDCRQNIFYSIHQVNGNKFLFPVKDYFR